MNNSNDKIPNENLTEFGIDDTTGSHLIQDAWTPNDGQFFIGNPIQEKKEHTIIKVNGVEAYSQLSSLYPGNSTIQKFIPQPGLDVNGKMPKGKLNLEPEKEYVHRNKTGFASKTTDVSGRTPLISPYPHSVQTSSTWQWAVNTTVRDLKRELYTGMGSRTNKYLLELDIPTVISPNDRPNYETLNILCQSTSFPQRNMAPAIVWRFGRKYQLRGEVDYGGSWTITFVDDSDMSIRRALDNWHIDIDDSTLQKTALNNLWDNTQNKLKGVPEEFRFLREAGYDYLNLAQFDGYERSLPNYQTDIKVFQLDQVGNRTYGYLLQNAFISEISQIDYADDSENQLTKFSCTITFSEFMPLDKHTMYFDIEKQY